MVMAHIMGLGNQSESWKIIILSQEFTNKLCDGHIKIAYSWKNFRKLKYCFYKVANSNNNISVQLFQKTLSKEKQKAHKPRLQGSMEIFETSYQCRCYAAKLSGGVWNYPTTLGSWLMGCLLFFWQHFLK